MTKRPLFQNGQWRIVDGFLGCRETEYWIDLRSLGRRHDPPNERDLAWVFHMSGKSWVDFDAFCVAFRAGLRIAKLKVDEADIARSEMICRDYLEDKAEFARIDPVIRDDEYGGFRRMSDVLDRTLRFFEWREKKRGRAA